MRKNDGAKRKQSTMQNRVASTQGDTSDCVARARTLAPLIAAHAGETERGRALAPAVLDALHAAQLFRMLLPRSCGGLEVEPAIFMQAIEEIAKADGSTAWCMVQGSGCSFAAAYLEPKVAREIYAD